MDALLESESLVNAMIHSIFVVMALTGSPDTTDPNCGQSIKALTGPITESFDRAVAKAIGPIAHSRLFKSTALQLLRLWMGTKELDALHQKLRSEGMSADSLAEHYLKALEIDINHDRARLESAKVDGPLIVVANHPFGMIDGLIALQLLKSVRSSVKIVSTDILHPIKEISSGDFILVDIHHTPWQATEAKRKNTSSLKKVLKTLRNDGTIIVFPAGQVSHYKFNRDSTIDRAWDTDFLKLALTEKAHILPLYFEGQNSWLFHTAQFLFQPLGSSHLGRQLLNKRGQTINVHIGPVIEHEDLIFRYNPTNPQSLRSMAEDLRAVIYNLKERE